MKKAFILTCFFLILCFSTASANFLRKPEPTPFRVKRIAVLPFELYFSCVDLYFGETFRDRLNILFNQVPGFLAIEPPPPFIGTDFKDEKNVKAQMPKIYGYYKKYRLDYVVSGIIKVEGVELYVISVNECKVNKLFVKIGTPFNFSAVEEVIKKLPKVGLPLPDDFYTDQLRTAVYYLSLIHI